MIERSLMKKLLFASLSLLLFGSLAWGQAEQRAIKADEVTDADSPECSDPTGSCTKFYDDDTLTRGKYPAKKRVDKLLGQEVRPAPAPTPGDSETDQ